MTPPVCSTADCGRHATHEADIYDGVSDTPYTVPFCVLCAQILAGGGESVRLLQGRHEPTMAAGELQGYSVRHAVARMRAWADANPWADTQGLMDDEWESLARAALGHWGWMGDDEGERG